MDKGNDSDTSNSYNGIYVNYLTAVDYFMLQHLRVSFSEEQSAIVIRAIEIASGITIEK